MTHPRRLLDSGDPVLRDLLGAGLRDNPRPRALTQAAVALGVPAITLPLASAAHAAGAAVQTVGTAAQAAGIVAPAAQAGAGLAGLGLSAVPSASSSILGIAGQWMLVGAMAGAAATGGWAALREAPSAPQESAPHSAPAVKTTPRPMPSPLRRTAAPSLATEISVSPIDVPSSASLVPAAAPVAPPQRLPEALPRIASPKVSSQPLPELAPREQDAPGALARETQLIDATRQALARQDVSQAQSLLATYDATRRLGVLDREALLLRIEGSTLRGERTRAEELARQFIARYPRDTHVPRLRATLLEPSAR